MVKSKFAYCINDLCKSRVAGKQSEHVCAGTARCVSGTAIELVWTCSDCATSHQEPIPKRRCRKRTWPYYNESVGVTFESESHEQKYTKANNLTPINE